MDSVDYVEQQLKNQEVSPEIKELRKKQKEKEEEITKSQTKRREEKKLLSEKIKNTLLYVGLYAAIIAGIAYIILTIVLIKGFETELSLNQQLLFSILGALFGLVITVSLRTQGVTLAKKEPNSRKVMAEYQKALNKTKPLKKLHTINFHFFWSIIRDIFFKVIIIAAYTTLLLSIFITGNGNWALIGLAFANLFMFAGFGLMALSSFYDKYLDEHIPVIEERTKKLIELGKEKEKEKFLNKNTEV